MTDEMTDHSVDSGGDASPTVWSVYLVRRADGALYTGIATDVARRFAEHECGRGAKSLRGQGPLELVLDRAVGDRGHALRVEFRLKQLTKVRKEALVEGRDDLAPLIDAVRPDGDSGAGA